MVRMSDGSNVGVEDGIEDVSVLGLDIVLRQVLLLALKMD